jgi:hypothetical protein
LKTTNLNYVRNLIIKITNILGSHCIAEIKATWSDPRRPEAGKHHAS